MDRPNRERPPEHAAEHDLRPLVPPRDPVDPVRSSPRSPADPPIIVRGAGRIRREALDPDAVFVVRRLRHMGHEAYLVGGCVRDLLLGLEPKDFDVATDATPNRIKRIFRSAFVIGRRFRLVHVRFPAGKVVETATFRRDPGGRPSEPEPTEETGTEEAEAFEDAGPDIEAPQDEVREGRRNDRRDERGRARQDRPDENVFGTAAEDAWRRDFTVNALFYDPADDRVVDHVGGLADLEARVIRAIGDPETRLREDPVRMLRALHFASRLGGDLEPSLRAAIGKCAGEIAKASSSRLYVELMKILGRGSARPTLRGLYELGVLKPWLPELVEFLDKPISWPGQGGGTHEAAAAGEPENTPGSHLTWNLLGAADAWGLAARGVPESLMIAVLLGPWLLESFDTGPRASHELAFHVEETFRPIALRMSVPRRVSYELREILWMLGKLRRPPDQRRRLRGLVQKPIFPEALAYFDLDLRARDQDLSPVERWHTIADDVWSHQAPARGEMREEGDAGELDPFGPPPSDDVMPLPLEEMPEARPMDGEPEDGRRRRRRRGGRGRGRAREDAPSSFDAGPVDDRHEPTPRIQDEIPRAPEPRVAPVAHPVPPPVPRPPPPPAQAPPPPPRPAAPPPSIPRPSAPPPPPPPPSAPAARPPAAPRPADPRPFGAGLA